MFPNGVESYLAGGALIGAGVALLFVATGLVSGMSTFYSAVWSWFSSAPHFRQSRYVSSRAWRVVLAIGLVAGAGLWTLAGHPVEATTVPALQLAIGGFIAGFGARMANGCTSGHGICGLGSLQASSLAAVVVFMITAIATANLVKALG